MNNIDLNKNQNNMNSDTINNIKHFIQEYYLLNRAPVTDDITFFIKKINEILPDGNIIHSKSNEECLTWITPQSWDVKSAILKDSSGKEIVNFKNNPLHLMQYSSAFKGEISFSDLEKHLYYSKEHPKDLPFINRKQYAFVKDNSWGISIPYELFQKLDRNVTYQVDIDVEFTNKELDVFDLLIPGETNDTIFFAAHSCHPGQVNDGIAGIALLIELFKWISSLPNRKYSYRFIVGPEYFAASVFLSKAKHVENLKFGYFLDMMVHNGTLGFSSSYEGNTLVDFVTENCLKKPVPNFEKYSYRELWGNDEMFYDGPDFKIPTIGLGRSHFNEYHLSSDDMNSVFDDKIVESFSLLQEIVLTFEKNITVQKKYKGPLYLSRYDLYIDAKKYRQAYRNLQFTEIEMNGINSVLDIAKKLDLDINFVYDFAQNLLKNKLAEKI